MPSLPQIVNDLKAMRDELAAQLQLIDTSLLHAAKAAAIDVTPAQRLLGPATNGNDANWPPPGFLDMTNADKVTAALQHEKRPMTSTQLLEKLRAVGWTSQAPPNNQRSVIEMTLKAGIPHKKFKSLGKIQSETRGGTGNGTRQVNIWGLPGWEKAARVLKRIQKRKKKQAAPEAEQPPA